MDAINDISIWALQGSQKMTSNDERTDEIQWKYTDNDKWSSEEKKRMYTSIVMTAGLLILSKCLFIRSSLKLLTCLYIV